MSVENQGMAGKLALLGALLVTSACGGHGSTPPGETGDGLASPASVEAKLVQVERVEVPRVIELYGSVESEKTAAVSARVMAMVTAMWVQSGDAVGKGQLLLEIDPQAAQGQLAQAKGALVQARAGRSLAERNFERFSALAATGAASELELDMARMQHEQANGAVEQAEGSVAAASSLAGDSRVVAPFAGRVVRKMVDVGDLAAPGRPLLMVESEGGRRLVLSVPESVMARSDLTVGYFVPVSVDARPDLGTVQGTVIEMSPRADPASHSFLVKVALPVEGIPSGASGRARIEVEKHVVIAIPEAAVMHRGGLSMVITRNALGRPSSRVVTVGEALAEGRVEILSGLAEGETIVLGLASIPPADTQIEDTGEETP